MLFPFPTPPRPANDNATAFLPVVARVNIDSGRITARPGVPAFDVASAGLGVLLLAEIPQDRAGGC